MEPAKSLVERLGYDADARLLIVNCDDVGSSHAANLACHEAMTAGVATSGTLMVPCAWAREAVDMFAGLDLGVHLTLTAEYPGYRWRSLTGGRSLHDSDGFLPSTAAAVFARAQIDEVRAECRAQVEQALAWGVDITHLDSHMGANQIDPRFLEVYVQLAQEYDLPLRMLGPDLEAMLGVSGRAMAAAAGLVCNDEFVSQWGRPTGELLRAALPELAAGVAEVNVHPVLDGPELRGYDKKEPLIRIDDHAVVMDPATRGFLDEQGFRMISFRPLRDLQRAGS
ncbi:MAG: ChbG/HpnK family deacetylase [Phenylobacterium sp.]|nr:ChbG/HpnK family deacetylase [Phenylobacterium sp.]